MTGVHEERIDTVLDTTTTGTESPSVLEVLRNAPFMLLFSAQFTQNIGAAVSWLALSFFIFKLTESPGLMGLLSVIFWLPYVLFTPFAGVFVDRYDQRKIMLFSNVLSMLASIGYVIIYLLRDVLTREFDTIVISEHGFPQQVHIISYIHVLWPLFVLTFLNSTAASIFFPTRNAYTRLIVKRKNLLVANSIGSTVFQVATIVGYVIAGVLAARSYLGSFIFDACTFAFSSSMIILILLIGKKPPEVIREKENTVRDQIKGVFIDLRIGYRTIRKAPKISYMLVVFASTIFAFSAFNVLFIVIVQGEMGLDETWYGVLQSVMGISGIIMSLTLMAIGRIKRKIYLLNFALIGAAAFLYLFAIIRNVWGIGILLFAFGIALASINVTAPTLIQEQVPYEKQGRVFGTQQLFQGFARIVGMGLVSIIAEYVLPKYILLVSAGFLSIVMILGMFYSRRSEIREDDYVIEDEPFESKNKQLPHQELFTAEPSEKASKEPVIE